MSLPPTLEQLSASHEAGHINVDSGHGPWPDGLQLFEQLRAGKCHR